MSTKDATKDPDKIKVYDGVSDKLSEESAQESDDAHKHRVHSHGG
jgi:hypothetical protein